MRQPRPCGMLASPVPGGRGPPRPAPGPQCQRVPYLQGQDSPRHPDSVQSMSSSRHTAVPLTVVGAPLHPEQGMPGHLLRGTFQPGSPDSGRARGGTRRCSRPGVAAGPVDGSSAADRHRSGGRLHPVRRHHDGHDRRVPGPRRPGRHPRQRALRCYRRLSVPAQHAHLGLDRPDRRPADGRSRLGGVLGPDVGRIVGISPSPPPTTRP